MDATTSTRDLLFTLLLKVGVASSIAALLARWNTFRRVLFTEERDPDQKLKLMLFMTPPLILGVTLRLVGYPYRFADLSLEGAFLMGLLGGRVVGPLGGAHHHPSRSHRSRMAGHARSRNRRPASAASSVKPSPTKKTSGILAPSLF